MSFGAVLAIMRAGKKEDRTVIIRIAISFFVSLLAVGAFAVDLSDRQRADIEDRIRPVSKLQT